MSNRTIKFNRNYYFQVLEEAKQKIPDELRQLAENGGGSDGRRDGGGGYANRW